MPDGELGVSDFGISAGGGARADRRDDERRRRWPRIARFDLAVEVRRITCAMVGLPIADDDIDAATAALKGGGRRLGGRTPVPGRRPRAQPDPVGRPPGLLPHQPRDRFRQPGGAAGGGRGGRRRAAGNGLRSTTSTRDRPTCVHGGVIAMVFDEMLGAANILAGNPGMTGTLTIRYRKPTPLRTPLRLEARFVGREGRKIRTYGAIYHGDVLTAEAEGIFIELVPQRFLAIVAENSDSPEAVEQVRADARRLGFAAD